MVANSDAEYSDVAEDWILQEDDVLTDDPEQESEEDMPAALSGEENEGVNLNCKELHTPAHDAQNKVLHRRMAQLVERCSISAEEGGNEEAMDTEKPTGWARARYNRVNCKDPHSQLVSDYAYDHLKLYRENIQSRKCADMHLYMNATRQFPGIGEPDPAGSSNCYPPSIDACEAILGVGDLSKYLIHLCPTGCEHWWTFMPDYGSHYQRCYGCDLCKCLHCGANRFRQDSKRGIRGAAMCWLFADVFQTMVLDAELAAAVLQGRAARNDPDLSDGHASKPSFAKYQEGRRLQEQLPCYGFDLKKVRCHPI